MGMSDEEQRVFFQVLAQMKERTERLITQICGAFNDTSGELLGTCTYIECHGSTYLLTAQHVAECLFDELKLAALRWPERVVVFDEGESQ